MMTILVLFLTTLPALVTSLPTTDAKTTSTATVTCNGKPDGTFLKDPQSCSNYYVCDHGVAIHQPCPGGLWFNLDLETCDYPYNVACAVTTAGTLPPTTATTTKETLIVNCDTSPCQNEGGGEDGGYSCKCVDGYTGHDCEIGHVPNIILIVADDLGCSDIRWATFGRPDIRTPNMSSIISSWGRFLTTFYVQPLCTPSRLQLLYSVHEMQSGLQHDVIHSGTRSAVDLKFQSLPQILRQTYGYRTHLVGKHHLGHYEAQYMPTNRGFDTFYGFLNGANDHYTHRALETFIDTVGIERTFDGHDFFNGQEPTSSADGLYTTDAIEDQFDAILDEHMANHEDQPFFIDLSFSAPHFPLQKPGTASDDICAQSETCVREYYIDMVEYMDAAIGRIHQKLVEGGVWENTILIFTSDNGGDNRYGGNNAPLRGRKGSLFEGGIKGAGFVASPLIDAEVRGTVDSSWLHISDFVPTLLNQVAAKSGIPLPPDDRQVFVGYDVWRALRTDETFEGRAELLHNIDPLARRQGEDDSATDFDETMMAAITAIKQDPLSGAMSRFKLITGNSDGSGYYNPTIDQAPDHEPDSTDKNLWLFDVEKNPLETRDLSQEQEYEAIINEMLARLQDFSEASTTEDPQDPLMDLLASPKLWSDTFWPWVQKEGYPLPQYSCSCTE